MKVLVTGGAGFVGSHCSAVLLDQGADVVVVDDYSNSLASVVNRIGDAVDRRVRAYECDILNCSGLNTVFDTEKPDAVIHCAGLKSVYESLRNPFSYYRVNVEGTLNVLSAMQRVNCNVFLFSSSATVYGDGQSVPPFSEECPRSAINPYGKSKIMVEDILRDISEAEKSWSIATLRYFNPVGSHPSHKIGENPTSRPDNLFPALLSKMSEPNPNVRVFGNDYDTRDGTCVRDFIHVMDLAVGHVKALELIAASPQHITLNLGTGLGYSVLEVIDTFREVSSLPLECVFGARRPGDTPVSIADVTLAREVIGWDPVKSLYEMCFDSIEFAKKNKS